MFAQWCRLLLGLVVYMLPLCLKTSKMAVDDVTVMTSVDADKGMSATCSHFLINTVVFNRQRSNNVLRRKTEDHTLYAWRVVTNYIQPKTEDHTICNPATRSTRQCVIRPKDDHKICCDVHQFIIRTNKVTKQYIRHDRGPYNMYACGT